MTHLALLRHAAGHVIGIGCALVVLKVTGHARSAGDPVIVVRVALVALQAGVHAGQRKPQRRVIHRGRLPCAGVVTVLAGHRKSGGHVIRIACPPIVVHVAARAGGLRAFELSPYVTIGALQAGMHARKGKSGELQVIELGPEPGRDRMTLLTSRRESGSDMARRISALIIPGVAGIALERESLELSRSRAFVAGIALQSCVRPDQREAVLVVLHRTNRDIPSFHRMAALAACSHLAAVDVGVAVGASRARVSEHRLGMASRAGDVFMSADQRIARAIVVELRHGAYRFPTDRGMAVLAGDIQIAVWAARDTGVLTLCACTAHNGQQNRAGQQPVQF